MRISDWSSDVCSSDLRRALARNRIEIQLDRGYRPVEIERLERRGMHHPERGKHRLGAEPQRSRLPRMPRRTCFTAHLKIVDRRVRRAEQRQRFRLCVESVETMPLASCPKVGQRVGEERVWK